MCIDVVLQEFVRVGYYVNNEYPEEEMELRENPPAVPQFDKCAKPHLMRWSALPTLRPFLVWLCSPLHIVCTQPRCGSRCDRHVLALQDCTEHLGGQTACHEVPHRV
jgi:ASF1 like histone chaperone